MGLQIRHQRRQRLIQLLDNGAVLIGQHYVSQPVPLTKFK